MPEVYKTIQHKVELLAQGFKAAARDNMAAPLVLAEKILSAAHYGDYGGIISYGKSLV